MLAPLYFARSFSEIVSLIIYGSLCVRRCSPFLIDITPLISITTIVRRFRLTVHRTVVGK